MVNAADNRAAGRLLFCIKLFEIFDQAQGRGRAAVISAFTNDDSAYQELLACDHSRPVPAAL
jgi:hypothetical protein